MFCSKCSLLKFQNRFTNAFSPAFKILFRSIVLMISQMPLFLCAAESKLTSLILKYLNIYQSPFYKDREVSHSQRTRENPFSTGTNDLSFYHIDRVSCCKTYFGVRTSSRLIGLMVVGRRKTRSVHFSAKERDRV